MKINQIVQETTTSGSVAPVEHGFVKMQTRNPGVYGGNKVGNLLKGKKTNKAFANSVNESAEISETDLSEQDLIVVPGQGHSRKNGFVPHGKSRVDHEVEMARSDLFSAAKNAKKVYSMIKDVGEDEGLDGWVQEKIIKANDYLNTIREYLEGKQVQGMNEGSQQVDSLVTDALKVIRGSDYQIDPVRAIKTVLGEREYNSRRGFYNFYVKQLRDMYDQEGLAEGSASDRFQLYGVRLDSKKKVSFGSFPTTDAAMVKADDLDTAGFDSMDPREDHDELHLLDTQTGQQFIYTDDGVNQEWEPIRRKKSVAEGNTEVRDNTGKVVSWKNDTEWHKAEKNKKGQPKDPRGVVTHLSDVARRKTEKQDTKEGKIDFAKKIQKNVDKSNKAVVQTKKEVGSRVADIGAGGKEYNVKTDKAWDDAQKAKKAK